MPATAPMAPVATGTVGQARIKRREASSQRVRMRDEPTGGVCRRVDGISPGQDNQVTTKLVEEAPLPPVGVTYVVEVVTLNPITVSSVYQFVR